MRKVLFTASVCLVVIGIIFLIIAFVQDRQLSLDEAQHESDLAYLKQQAQITETIPAETDAPETALVTETEAVTEPVETEPIVTEPAETEPPAKQPPKDLVLDFKWLKKVNPDIYAWIEIPGTRVDYPVLQNAKNDRTYLSTAYDGQPYIGGAIFTEAKYNTTSFNDPVTLIYGHTMRAGTLFGSLQSVYSDREKFKASSDIKIYLPGEVRHYTVFAVVPYGTEHILKNYDFSDETVFKSFFESVRRIRGIGVNFDLEQFPVFGEKVIILSTCMTGNPKKRYLVMAVWEE